MGPFVLQFQVVSNLVGGSNNLVEVIQKTETSNSSVSYDSVNTEIVAGGSNEIITDSQGSHSASCGFKMEKPKCQNSPEMSENIQFFVQTSNTQSSHVTPKEILSPFFALAYKENLSN